LAWCLKVVDKKNNIMSVSWSQKLNHGRLKAYGWNITRLSSVVLKEDLLIMARWRDIFATDVSLFQQRL